MRAQTQVLGTGAAREEQLLEMIERERETERESQKWEDTDKVTGKERQRGNKVRDGGG